MENPVAHLSPYELRHLAAHMQEAGRVEQLRHLLWLDWQAGEPGDARSHRNAWFERKNEIGDLDGYLADVRRAMRMAEAQVEGQGWIDVLRCVLILTSINSRALQTPPALLAAQACCGLTSFEQALALARQMPNFQDQRQALIGLAQKQPVARQKQVLETVLSLESDAERGEALAELAKVVQVELLGLLAEAAYGVGNPSARARAFLELARRRIPDSFMEHVTQSCYAAFEVRDAFERVRAMADVCSFLAEPTLGIVLKAAQEAAHSISSPMTRGRALALVGPALARAGALDTLIETLNGLQYELELESVLATTARYLPVGVLRQLVDWARSRRDSLPDRMAFIAPYLPEPQRRELLSEAIGVELEKPAAGISLRQTKELTPFLQIQQLDAVRPVILQGEDEILQAEAQAAWCRRMAVLGHPHQARDAARAGLSPFAQVLALAGQVELQCEGSEQMVEQALRALEKVRDSVQWRMAIDRLAPLLPADLLQGLSLPESVTDHDFLALALAALAEQLPATARGELVQEALALLERANHGTAGALAMLVLFPLLEDAQQEAYLPLLFAELQAARTRDRYLLLNNLPGVLPDALLARAAGELMKLEPSEVAAGAAARLAPRLTDAPLRELLNWALERLKEAKALDTYSSQAAYALLQQLARLAPQRALALCKKIEPEKHRLPALGMVAKVLPAHLARQALAQAQIPAGNQEAGADIRQRESVLRALLPHLAETEPAAALEQAVRLTIPQMRADCLAALLQVLPPDLCPTARSQFLEALKSISAPADLVNALAAMLPRSQSDLQADALAILWPALEELERRQAEKKGGVLDEYLAKSLAFLADYGNQSQRERMLTLALHSAAEFVTRDGKASALYDVAPWLPEPFVRNALRQAVMLDEDGVTSNPRAVALQGLLPRLVELGFPDQAFYGARLISDPVDCAITLLSISSQAQKQEVPGQAALWFRTLGEMAGRPRLALLASILSVAAPLARSTSLRDITEFARALLTAEAWWPFGGMYGRPDDPARQQGGYRNRIFDFSPNQLKIDLPAGSGAA